MIKFEVLNELTLKITSSGQTSIFTKAGAFIGGTNQGEKNYKFEKVLLGPQGNMGQALLGQLTRRLTGENLPLMRVDSYGQNVTYYANLAQHVLVYQLQQGETISVESENILAFTNDCKYSVRFLAQGVISQKGLATSTLTGNGPEAFVAILTDGNPLVLTNNGTGETIEVDPDAVVCWIGADPGFKTDLSWKNLIGQGSGESYMFEWSPQAQAIVVIQPNERSDSGLDVSIDDSSHRPTTQHSSASLGMLGSLINNM